MSEATRKAFDERVARALGDAELRATIRLNQDYMQDRAVACREEIDWPAWRDAVAEVRRHTVAHLDAYLAQFMTNVERRGGHVFCAADADEARAYVVELARRKQARLIVKGKSMVTEEIALNPALQALGAEVVETDLGEFIIQQCGERPFHLVGPAMHKSTSQICELFCSLAGERLPEDATELTRFARRRLRPKFLTADMGITGGNFGVADTGTVMLVTNEGNGRMTTTLPRTHVVVMGIERLVPDFASLEPILTLLPWAGGGERVTTYFTAITGPRREGDLDGPEELHVVLVDNGRSQLLGGGYQDVLHCIRCGACLDNCPVFRHIGGHAYNATYTGPIGAVLMPLLEGLTEHADLAFASSLCGACSDVCSAGIPLAEHLRELRGVAHAYDDSARAWQAALSVYAELTRRPRLFGLAERLGRLGLRPWARGEVVRRAPGPLAAWTQSRDLRLPASRSFRRLWRLKPARAAANSGDGGRQTTEGAAAGADGAQRPEGTP